MTMRSRRARRLGRSQVLEVEVDSWRDSAGKLWEPNFKVPLDLPALKLTNKEWLIAEVTYLRGKTDTRAHLTLMPEEASQPEPVILGPFDWQVAGGAGEIPPQSSIWAWRRRRSWQVKRADHSGRLPFHPDYCRRRIQCAG